MESSSGRSIFSSRFGQFHGEVIERLAIAVLGVGEGAEQAAIAVDALADLHGKWCRSVW